MSDLLHYAKTTGKVGLDVFGGFGWAVGFADASGYYYASAGLNAILQTQFQASGWPTGTSKVGNKGDVKGAIMFARDQYYAKAKSNFSGALTDLGKNFLGYTAGFLTGTGWFGLGASLVKGTVEGGLQAMEWYEGSGKLKGAYHDINSFNNVPKVPEGPAKSAARVLVNHSYAQKSYPEKSKGRAAADAIGYILGTEVSAYRSKSFAFSTQQNAIERVAAWLTVSD